MKLSIIIPCFNEEKTIFKIIEKVSLAPLPLGWEREIIVIDDGSTDGTRRFLQDVINTNFNIKIIQKAKNEGKGAALKMGFSAASGDYIIVQDADVEYDPFQYRKLLTPIIRKEADIVFGSRNLEETNLPSHVLYLYGGLAITAIFNLFFRTQLTDITACYKVFPCSFVPQLLHFPHNNFSYDAIELTYALARGGKIIEVPIRYTGRTKKDGKKLHWSNGFTFLLVILKLKYNEITHTRRTPPTTSAIP